jgi:hypothetical protein
MKTLTLLTTLTGAASSRIAFPNTQLDAPSTNNAHRERHLSGDAISYDDDFWAYNADNVDVSSQTIWTDYSFMPVKCMVL